MQLYREDIGKLAPGSHHFVLRFGAPPGQYLLTLSLNGRAYSRVLIKK